jgi:hypothetical protein
VNTSFYKDYSQTLDNAELIEELEISVHEFIKIRNILWINLITAMPKAMDIKEIIQHPLIRARV